MTTAPIPTPETLTPVENAGIENAGERTGAICLRLESLGIDHQAGDFPARFIEFCEQNTAATSPLTIRPTGTKWK